MKLTPLRGGGLGVKLTAQDRREGRGSWQYGYALFLIHQERLAAQRHIDAKRAPTLLARAQEEVEAERDLAEIRAKKARLTKRMSR